MIERYLMLGILAGCGSVVDNKVDARGDAPPTSDAPTADGPPIDAPPKTGLFLLTTTPDPATVFNNIAETYRFNNNLVNSIWHRPSDHIISGEFSTAAYWSFASTDATHVATPDQGTTIHGRLVQVPATNHAIYSTTASPHTTPAPAASFVIGTINVTTGLIEGDQAVVFSDNFTGNCQLTSSTATEFLCFDGTLIRRYLTTAASATLTANGTIPLSVALPAAATCATTPCYGSTFAFDGAFLYFSAAPSSANNLAYIVYNANGTLVNTYTAAGVGSICSAYFDWSVGRYSNHDGFGGRTGGTVHDAGLGSDSHVFTPISTHHTLDI